MKMTDDTQILVRWCGKRALPPHRSIYPQWENLCCNCRYDEPHRVMSLMFTSNHRRSGGWVERRKGSEVEGREEGRMHVVVNATMGRQDDAAVRVDGDGGGAAMQQE